MLLLFTYMCSSFIIQNRVKSVNANLVADIKLSNPHVDVLVSKPLGHDSGHPQIIRWEVDLNISIGEKKNKQIFI